MTYRGPAGDNSGRFCSANCRELYDAGGFSAHDPTYHHKKDNPRWYRLPLGKRGFLIECAGCSKAFDSKGQWCCSPECERAYRDRGAIEKLKAEAGVEFQSKLGVKRKCERDGCGRDIPRWRNGRLVSKATRFCSPKCQQGARKGQTSVVILTLVSHGRLY
jgi:predicted nucleic acid-binding Zn ribbon protein